MVVGQCKPGMRGEDRQGVFLSWLPFGAMLLHIRFKILLVHEMLTILSGLQGFMYISK